MDLESESSAVEYAEDNEVTTPERLANVDGNKIENNGSCGDEYGDDNLLAHTKAKDVGVAESANSPLVNANSPAGSVGSSPPATTKGYGLKKWKRIKREFNKDGRSNTDTSKILKRGLSTSIANSSKPQGTTEPRQKSDGSLSSTNATVKIISVAADGFPLNASSSVAGPNFAAGTDSENSEDRSSKSSTATSVPKSRNENPPVVGYAGDKNKMRTLSGKTLVNSVQRGQQGKSRIETGKKHRGERVKIEKENSHSSMESDSRSSNFIFMQGTNTVTSNGRQSGRSMNYDGENSDEAQDGEQQFSEELQTGYQKENVEEFEALSQEDLTADLSWEVKEEKVENNRSSTDRDPLVESIYTLQSAQEELEKELQKLRGIGIEHISLSKGSTQGNSLPSEFASIDSRIHEASSSDLFRSGDTTRSFSSHFPETQVFSLKQNINILESKLEEANNLLKLKEAKVAELEHALKSNESPKEEMWSTSESQHENNREIEAELEGLFKQKIEAEVEYLAISGTNQKLRDALVDQVTLFEEQKTLASGQAQMLNELGDVGSKAAMLKRQAKKLETYYEDMVGTEQVLKLQTRVCKVTSCFLVQMVLVIVVFVLFFLQLSPFYEGVVPT